MNSQEEALVQRLHTIVECYVNKRKTRQHSISVRGAMQEIESLMPGAELTNRVLEEAIVRLAHMNGLAVHFDNGDGTEQRSGPAFE